jgi:hypothetical protein
MDKFTEIIGAEALMPGASRDDIDAAISRIADLPRSEEIVECLRALKQRNIYGALINVRAAIAAAARPGYPMFNWVDGWAD